MSLAILSHLAQAQSASLEKKETVSFLSANRRCLRAKHKQNNRHEETQ